MLTLFFKALKALNSDYSPAQISLAVCLGMIIGLTPLGSVHNAIFFLFVLKFRPFEFLTAYNGDQWHINDFLRATSLCPWCPYIQLYTPRNSNSLTFS